MEHAWCILQKHCCQMHILFEEPSLKVLVFSETTALRWCLEARHNNQNPLKWITLFKRQFIWTHLLYIHYKWDSKTKWTDEAAGFHLFVLSSYIVTTLLLYDCKTYVFTSCIYFNLKQINVPICTVALPVLGSRCYDV